jgi:GDP-4-dehydro-6-deoxy-D-mannose reductase
VRRPTLVTGAAGFAGSHLLDLLTRETDLPLVAWYRPEGARPLALPGVTWEPVDLLDRTRVHDQLSRLRPAAVYHCAGAAHVGQSWNDTERTFATNLRGMQHLLEGLRRTAEPSRVLLPSSAMVYADADHPLREDDPIKPASPYALSKLAQELLAADYPGGPEVVIARAFNHIGPRQDPIYSISGFARRIAEIESGHDRPELAVGNLEAQRDVTDVRDTVRAYRLLLERGQPGRVYNVCSGRALSIRALLDMLLARARVPIAVRTDPARYRPNDSPLVVGDPARLRDELGWSPRISIDRTIDDVLGHWRTESRRTTEAS